MENQKNKKKVLIFSMTGGFGHIRAGEALLDYIKEHRLDLNAEHIDIVNVDDFFRFSSKLYDALIKKIPIIWRFIYFSMNLRPVSFLFKKISGLNLFFNRKFKKIVLDKKPDAIIFTNTIPLTGFLTSCKKEIAHAKLGVVVTDYHGHSYYNFKRVDYYFVANDEVKNDLNKIGIKKERIIVTGIPINPRFYIEQDVNELKQKYGIKNDFPTILLIASFRMSKKDLIKTIGQILNLRFKVNLIFVANGNQNIFNMAKNNFGENKQLFLVNWTNMMEEYMKISDVIISKAGGLTVSEALSLKKPLIIVNPIPGQEEYNADFVQRNNYGVKVKAGEIAKFLPKMLSERNMGERFLPQENPCSKIIGYF